MSSTFVSTSETALYCEGRLLAERCEVKRGPVGRSIGLIGHAPLGEDEAMLITRCAAIHTYFMSFAIDVVFVDRGMSVVGLLESVRPWRSPRRVRGARHAIELPAGRIRETGIAVGDRITFETAPIGAAMLYGTCGE